MKAVSMVLIFSSLTVFSGCEEGALKTGPQFKPAEAKQPPKTTPVSQVEDLIHRCILSATDKQFPKTTSSLTLCIDKNNPSETHQKLRLADNALGETITIDSLGMNLNSSNTATLSALISCRNSLGTLLNQFSEQQTSYPDSRESHDSLQMGSKATFLVTIACDYVNDCED